MEGSDIATRILAQEKGYLHTSMAQCKHLAVIDPAMQLPVVLKSHD